MGRLEIFGIKFMKKLNESKVKFIKSIIKKINEGSFKISRSYWDSLSDDEQEYFKSRVNIEGVQNLKTLLSAAKKQLPGYDKIWGDGFVKKYGKTYQCIG